MLIILGKAKSFKLFYFGLAIKDYLIKKVKIIPNL